ncbi:MAG: Stringent starvation protein B [uncultured Thiotrichaceae bacterium]|uniref:Stringent starvation protein B n=1 Tax=uncultured Thiotrichaceae bacterium TaxID=298394 RepID=A0A6S6SZ13_9GAMM|nr:MAG: Stringent starvation protein B [uncultured Thiotrichaceae bacterium]
MSDMSPKRPYLLRAFYDWIVDNNMTPHILVNAEAEDVNVPRQHVNDGKIVLNISPSAIQDFMVDNEALSFSARFGGVSFYIYCPMYSIEALYAREAPTEGVSFSADEYDGTESAPAAAQSGGLKAVSAPALSAVSDISATKSSDETDPADADEGGHDDKPPPRKRPSLRVIK